MSVMSMIDLQCVEVQDRMLTLSDGDPLPEAFAVEMAQHLTYHLTPVESWEFTLPHMIRWVYENLELTPAIRH